MGDRSFKSPNTQHDEIQRQQQDLYEQRQRLQEEVHQESQRSQSDNHAENQSKQNWMLAICSLTLLLVTIAGYKDISNSVDSLWTNLKPAVIDTPEPLVIDDEISELPHWPW